jgi:hypothetical protein
MARKREVRVREAMAMMASGAYVLGQTSFVLAEKWGLTHDSVRHITGEASRRLVAGVALEPEMKSLLFVTIQQIGSDCEALTKALSSSSRPNVGEYLATLRLKFDICRYLHGANVDVPRGTDLSTKSERELLEIIARSTQE